MGCIGRPALRRVRPRPRDIAVVWVDCVPTRIVTAIMSTVRPVNGIKKIVVCSRVRSNGIPDLI
jgi:hypothetical protein